MKALKDILVNARERIEIHSDLSLYPTIDNHQQQLANGEACRLTLIQKGNRMQLAHWYST
jgi:hypothetical protein